MSNNLNYKTNEQENSFDVKYYVFKVLGYWQLFLVTIIIALIIARFMNGYKQKRYSLSTVISIKEETNPLFNTGTNLTFNWGGASDLLETIKITLASRKHNKKVVSRLQFYIDYLKDGKYRLEDVYGKTPFKIYVDTSSYQLYANLIKIETLDNNRVNISFEFNESGNNSLIRYSDNSIENYTTNEKSFSKDYDLNSDVITPFFNFNISSNGNSTAGNIYYIKFNSLYGTVGRYQGVRVTDVTNGASVMRLQFQGGNKNRIVDYLNTSVDVLTKDKQNDKTRFATNTRDYIDTLFNIEARKLQKIQKDIGDYKKTNNVYDLSVEATNIISQTRKLDTELRQFNESLDFLDDLEKKLRSNTFYANNFPVPALVKIEDSKIPLGVTELIAKYKSKEVIENFAKPTHPEYKKIVRDIKLSTDILLENINNLRLAHKKTRLDIQKRLNESNADLRELPGKEQQLIKYERDYAYSEFNYSYLKQKSYEASTAINASVPDIKVIDSAMDLGQGSIYPNPGFNYSVAIMLGIIFPLFYIIIRELLDNKIHTIDDIEKKYRIPVLGVVGRNTGANNLAVFERPKSSVAESFRALRSNIQFLFKNNTEKKSRTLVLTSSVSGEGKTMISTNMATVFALSGKKTVLIGLDLRKPKIYNDFDLKNEVGVVNYLINQRTLDEVIITSKIPNLDIILSGPIPPNPSELLLSDKCNELIEKLQETYDYIVIDTPPVGLVSDALELFKYADAICYVVRQEYTQKGMMKMIDDKYSNKEVTNISYLLNDFTIRSKYGYAFPYGYGYGKYGNGYHENEEVRPTSLIGRVINLIKPKR